MLRLGLWRVVHDAVVAAADPAMVSPGGAPAVRLGRHSYQSGAQRRVGAEADAEASVGRFQPLSRDYRLPAAGVGPAAGRRCRQQSLASTYGVMVTGPIRP